MLQYYVKAINHLQEHFALRSKTSYRIILVTSVIFVCLDLLRGHIQQAERHLQNGLQILAEMKLLSSGDDDLLCLNTGHDTPDRWIVEACARLQFQHQLFSPARQKNSIKLVDTGTSLGLASEFTSVDQAWQHLQRSFKHISYLEDLARSHSPLQNGGTGVCCDQLTQGHIKTALAVWLQRWDIFSQNHLGASDEHLKVNWVLRCYHLMSLILANVCLSPDDELAYDLHTNYFDLLLEYFIKLRHISLGDDASPVVSINQAIDIERSVIDLGTIQPLYFVAIRCRVRRIRLQAISFLESMSHREGMWDAKTAGCVARKIMELEEGSHHQRMCDGLSLRDCPRPENTSPPTLPDTSRLRHVQVELLGEPMNAILLRYQKNTGIDRISRFEVEYEMRSCQWKNIQGVEEVYRPLSHRT